MWKKTKIIVGEGHNIIKKINQIIITDKIQQNTYYYNKYNSQIKMKNNKMTIYFGCSAAPCRRNHAVQLKNKRKRTLLFY